MPPVVPFCLPGNLRRGRRGREPFADDHLLYAGDIGEGPVQRLLHRHRLPAAQESVGSKDGLGAGVIETVADGRWAVSAEKGQDDPTYLDHRQKSDCQFGDHRHVQSDGIAASDAKAAQGIGAATDFVVKLGVGKGDVSALLPFPDECEFGRGLGCLPLVEAVVDDVHLPVDTPPGEGRAGRKIDNLRVGMGEADIEILHHCIPEPADILHRARQQRVIRSDAVPIHETLQIALGDPVRIWLPCYVLAEGEGVGGHDLFRIGDGLAPA